MKKLNTDSGNYGVIYARYSSHNQRDISIQQQLDKCYEHADRLGITVITEYTDKAISGKTDNRPAFQRLMHDATTGKFQYVIAWKSNRMGRNMLQAMMNEARLQDHEVRILYVEEDFDDTAAGRFALRNMQNVNQFYSENMAEDIKRGLYDNAEKCKINGSVPYGYKRGGDGRYEIVEQEAAIIREIFSRMLAGELIVDITNDLNNRGLRTKRGYLWNKSSFNKLLKNERYVGIYVYSDIRIEGGVPQIVDREVFDAMQEQLKTKKNPRNSPTKRRNSNGVYLLTGKLYCGHCKSPMVGISGTGRSKLYYYYNCKRRISDHDCSKKQVRRDIIERSITNALKEALLKEDVINWVANSVVAFQEKYRDTSILDSLNVQLSEIKKAKNNILKAIEQGIITDTTKDRLLQLEEEERNIKYRVRLEEQDALIDVSKDEVVEWMHSLENGDVDDKSYQAQLIDSFLVAAYLYDDHLRLIFNFTKTDNEIDIPFDITNFEKKSVRIKDSYKFSLAPPPKLLAFDTKLVVYFLPLCALKPLIYKDLLVGFV